MYLNILGIKYQEKIWKQKVLVKVEINVGLVKTLCLGLKQLSEHTLSSISAYMVLNQSACNYRYT